MKDASGGELLLVEVGNVDGDVAEDVGGGATAENLDGAEGVEDNGVYFAILNIGDGALTQGDNVAVVDFRFH